MAIAFDTATGGTGVGADPITISMTIGSGSDRVLVVGAGCDNSSDTITGSGTCSYNGVAMTLAVSKADGVKQFQYMWVLANPDSGTHNIVMNPASGTVSSVVAASFTGVDQATPYDSTAAEQLSTHTSPQDISITASTNGMIVDMVGTSNSGVTLTKDASQTQASTTRDTGFGVTAMSYKASSGADTMTWTYSGNMIMTQLAVALKEASGGGGTVLPSQMVKQFYVLP